MRYENAELEIVMFLAEDVIATSTVETEPVVTEPPVQGGGMGGDSEGELDDL
jgi:hypothetical protein